MLRAGAPGDHRCHLGGIEPVLGGEGRALCGGERPPLRDGRVPQRARRRIGAPRQKGEGRLVGSDDRAERGEFGRHVAERHARFHVERAHRCARKFDDVPLGAARAQAADDVQRQILGGHTRAEPPLDGDAHVAGPLDAQRHRRQRMFRLGRADAPGDGAERALRAGVAIGAGKREAGEHDALLRGDDVNDALAGIVQIEQRDAVPERARAHRRQEGLARRHQRIVAAPSEGIDDMIHRREDARRRGHNAVRIVQTLQRHAARALVQEQPIHREQIRIAAERGDDVRIPDRAR